MNASWPQRARVACTLVCLVALAACSRQTAPIPRKIIDLSPTITEDLPVRAWGPRLLRDFGFRETTEFEHVAIEDPLYVVDSYLTLFNHGGAHLDAPNHVEKGAKSIDAYPLSQLMGRARVLDARPYASDEPIPRADVERMGVRTGEVFILLVGYVAPTGEDELPSYPFLSEAAAEYLAALPIRGFATDAFSVESATRMYARIDAGEKGAPNILPLHHVFLSREIPVFEQLVNVEALLDEGEVVFVGFPLKIEGGNGSPVRAAGLVY